MFNKYVTPLMLRKYGRRRIDPARKLVCHILFRIVKDGDCHAALVANIYYSE